MSEKHKPSEIEIGEFISIPAWGVEGMVIGIETSMLGNDGARVVTMEEYPGEKNPSKYHLSPGEFKFES